MFFRIIFIMISVPSSDVEEEYLPEELLSLHGIV
jgi:hypothetical protein